MVMLSNYVLCCECVKVSIDAQMLAIHYSFTRETFRLSVMSINGVLYYLTHILKTSMDIS